MTAPPAGLEPLDAAMHSLLGGIASPTATALRRAGSRRVYAPGERLFLQGDPPSLLIVLAAGRVKVWRALPEGGAMMLTLLRQGAPLGTLGTVRNAPHTATATALTRVEAFVWPIEAVRQAMTRDPTLIANLLLTVTNYAEQMIERLEEVATVPVEQRLARTLIRLTRNPWGTDLPAEAPLPLSRQDLADLTSATLPTVSRIMSRWRGEGLVDGGRGEVKVLAPDRLAALANLPSGWERPLESALAPPV